MKTKPQILETSRLLFNQNGVMNVTLRDVAKAINKSYGNITYHFPTKEEVVTTLFEEMNTALSSLQRPTDAPDLMRYLLELPNASYDISLKYLFFTIDYSELKRNYPKLFERVSTLNNERKSRWMELLIYLRESGNFHQNLSDGDFEYLMFLSVSVRSAYFQFTDSKAYSKDAYTLLTNQLLKAYLSPKGMAIYEQWSQAL